MAGKVVLARNHANMIRFSGKIMCKNKDLELFR